MGDLPQERISPSSAFTHTGLDYCDPVSTKSKRKKVYVAIFYCFSTKTVHWSRSKHLLMKPTSPSFNDFWHVMGCLKQSTATPRAPSRGATPSLNYKKVSSTEGQRRFGTLYCLPQDTIAHNTTTFSPFQWPVGRSSQVLETPSDENNWKNYATPRRIDNAAEQYRSHNEFSSAYSSIQRSQLLSCSHASSSSNRTPTTSCSRF